MAVCRSMTPWSHWSQSDPPCTLQPPASHHHSCQRNSRSMGPYTTSSYTKCYAFLKNISKIHNFSKSISLLNIFLIDPGQDLPKGLRSRDHFQPPYIVFRIFPRPNFEIAARGRHRRFAGLAYFSGFKRFS